MKRIREKSGKICHCDIKISKILCPSPEPSTYGEVEIWDPRNNVTNFCCRLASSCYWFTWVMHEEINERKSYILCEKFTENEFCIVEGVMESCWALFSLSVVCHICALCLNHLKEFHAVWHLPFGVQWHIVVDGGSWFQMVKERFQVELPAQNCTCLLMSFWSAILPIIS